MEYQVLFGPNFFFGPFHCSMLHIGGTNTRLDVFFGAVRTNVEAG
jgi:hypothetical protein